MQPHLSFINQVCQNHPLIRLSQGQEKIEHKMKKVHSGVNMKKTKAINKLHKQVAQIPMYLLLLQ